MSDTLLDEKLIRSNNQILARQRRKQDPRHQWFIIHQMDPIRQHLGTAYMNPSKNNPIESPISYQSKTVYANQKARTLTDQKAGPTLHKSTTATVAQGSANATACEG